jgi:hypothetical protein
MHCASCQSSDLERFSTEMMIHSSGEENIGDPGILAFQKVLVCLSCGFSEFTIPVNDLMLLASKSTRSVLKGRIENCAPIT